MAELTLESLARRIELLERRVDELTRPAIRPGTGDWDAAEKAMRELEDYDYGAPRDQDECDRKHARDHLP